MITLKEYNDIEEINLDEDYLVISPTGKIVKLDPDNINEELINYMDSKNVDYNETIEMINRELYMRGYEKEEISTVDVKKIIRDFFGYIIYDNTTHSFDYSRKNSMYNKITNVQKEIILKIEEKLGFENHIEGDENLCKIGKRR